MDETTPVLGIGDKTYTVSTSRMSYRGNLVVRTMCAIVLVWLCTLSMSTVVCAQPINGAVVARPNTIYYASGSCVFYDAKLMELLRVDAAEASWSCSPATAAWVVVSPPGGYFEFPNYGMEQQTVSSTVLLKPFWSSDTVFSESVLLEGVGSTADLLYAPKRIISVTNYSDKDTFTVGVDIAINGRTIKQLTSRVSASVRIKPGLRGNGRPNGLMNTQHTSWSHVTYIPDRSGDSLQWNPGRGTLPRTWDLIKRHQPCTIQAVGMSITAGHNTSGFIGDERNFPPSDPYMRGYVDLLAEAVSMKTSQDVRLHNASCGGKTAAWAATFVTPLVVPNNPDLVLIDFGMNDIWGQTTASAFKEHISSCISQIRKSCPSAEFVLIANMLPDTAAPGAPTNGAVIMREFLQELRSLEQTGVAVLDMTSMSQSLYQRKGARNCTANSLHPNDYLVRWYAQGLADLIMGDSRVTTVDHSSDRSDRIASIVAADHASVTIALPEVFTTAQQSMSISVFDVHGREIPIRNVSHNGPVVNLDVHGSSGVFVAVISAQTTAITASFVIY